MRTHFNENFLWQSINRSSSDGPNKSITIQFQAYSYPNQNNYGIPALEKQKKKKR
jgi:hypothetical protein